MATASRQVGRRGVNTTTTNASVATPPRSSTSTPPRRYVLDVPSGRTVRTSRTAANRLTDEYDLSNARSRSMGATTITDDAAEQISRSGSREYYYRDGASESSAATVSRYLEDASIKQLMESGQGYTNTAAEDQEVQALTAQATPDVKNYPINVDNNPELIVRPNTQRLTYTQDIAVRYLKPSTPPPPGVRFSIFYLRLTYFNALSSRLLSARFALHLHLPLRRSFSVNVLLHREHLRR